MNKKGVELSMNLIIIAAIGLLVLVILAVLVINAVNNTNSGMKSCNVMGGICQSYCSGETLQGDCGKNAAKPYCCKVITLDTATP